MKMRVTYEFDFENRESFQSLCEVIDKEGRNIIPAEKEMLDRCTPCTAVVCIRTIEVFERV